MYEVQFNPHFGIDIKQTQLLVIVSSIASLYVDKGSEHDLQT